MRLLIFGHWSHTGFGVVTERLSTEFLARGIDVRVLAVNHRGEPVRGPMAGRVWPANMFGDGFGGNISAGAIDGSLWRRLSRDDDWAPDQVLVVSDMSGFQGHIGKLHEAWLSKPVWHYCPIEGDNLPVSWRDIWLNPANGRLPGSFRPVAMARYGKDVLDTFLGRDIPLIHHGVDTDTFRPVSAAAPLEWEGRVLRTKADCKRAFGLNPDAPVILRTDRHVPRKFYDVLLRSMRDVFEQRPDAQLVIHCRPEDEGGSLYEEIARLPREQWPQVRLTQAHDTWTGLPVEGLVALYNAADVYVSTTSGEGFGLTLAEAVACGVPVVTTDYAAGPEVIGPGGVAVAPLIDRYGEIVRYHSTYGMDWAVPDARGFVQPVLDLLAKPHRRASMGEAGRRHVRRSFTWTAAAEQFTDLFESAQPAEAAA